MNLYMISYGSHILENYDCVYVWAQDEDKALREGKSKIDVNKPIPAHFIKLHPDFVEEYKKFNVYKLL